MFSKLEQITTTELENILMGQKYNIIISCPHKNLRCVASKFPFKSIGGSLSHLLESPKNHRSSPFIAYSSPQQCWQQILQSPESNWLKFLMIPERQSNSGEYPMICFHTTLTSLNSIPEFYWVKWDVLTTNHLGLPMNYSFCMVCGLELPLVPISKLRSKYAPVILFILTCEDYHSGYMP